MGLSRSHGIVASRALSVAVALAISFVAACSSDSEPALEDASRSDTCRGDECGSQGDTSDGAISCTSSGECSGVLECNEATGFCAMPCDDDQQCSEHQRCDLATGFCAARELCASSADCGDGVCDTCTSYCIPTPDARPCAEDFNCEFEEFCDPCTMHCSPRLQLCDPCSVDAQCGEARDRCLTFQDGSQFCGQHCGICPPGFLCDEQLAQCVPAAGGCGSQLVCERDVECQRGEICADNGLCVRGCGADAECPGAKVCSAGRCTEPCSSDDECDGDLSCQDSRCMRPGGCLTSAECSEPETYCDSEIYTCVGGCRFDDDCMDATKECINSRCEERLCTGNYACAFMEVCNLETGRCEEAEGDHCAPCDGSDVDSCGTSNICVEGETEDGQPVGPWCFVECGPDSANPCPQGFQCREVDVDGDLRNVCHRPTCDDVAR